MADSASARVVAIRGEQQGTGVLLTPRHVLTCAHVLGDRAVAQIRHPRTGAAVPGDVVWNGSADGLDAALVRCAEDVLPAGELPALRWGRLTRDDAVPGCQTIGFPAHQRHPFGERSRTRGPAKLDLGQYRGSVLPVSGRGNGVLTFWLDHTPGTPSPAGASPLAGLSGAPVFAGPVLLGLVSRVRETEGHQHLEAVPAPAIRGVLASRGDVRLPPLEDVGEFDPRDGAHEERYARALKARYGKTEIFGIDDLGISESSWDLDTAYLSLEAADSAADDRSWASAHDPGGLPPRDSRPRRVEELLGRRPRTLVRGEAGAGKTTLVWWLAAHAACGTLPAELDELNGLVPFVIPLRAVQAQGGVFPGPDELARFAELPVGQAPDGWAVRVLESGRALLLVDGVDELPQALRPKARTWLTRFLKHHDKSRCIATVRPGAVETDWLTGEGFADLRLLPMSDDDIDSFVTAWHSAARLEYAPLGPARADAEKQRLAELERKLHQEFADNRVLRDLARTPLLCAVVCALHRKRRGALPRTRWDLYRATLDMLLGNRDSARGINAPDGLCLSVEEHKLLLQHIAVWLVREGQTQLTPSQALTQLERATAAMPQVRAQGTAQEVLTHLINRSGLLQQLTGDVIQFIHRTFQDYLAAKEFAEADSVGELVGHAADEQWRDVIRLSVCHFDRRVSALIERLIEAGDALGPRGRSVHILAGQCATSAVFLDEGVRGEALRRIEALMPPRSGEAPELAAIGPDVLPLLPGPTRGDVIDAGIIDTIARVGAEEGIEKLVEFIDWPSPVVRQALANAWSEFPPERYAREVLARIELPDVLVKIYSPEQLHQLPSCETPTNVMACGNHTSESLDAHLPQDLLALYLVGNNQEIDLSLLQDRADVMQLSFADCPGLGSLDPIADRCFKYIGLEADVLLRGGRFPQAQTLSILGKAPLPLDALSHWSNISTLLVQSSTPLSLLLDAVQGFPSLNRLHLLSHHSTGWQESRSTEAITHLVLEPRTALDMGEVTRVFPALQQLRLLLRDIEHDMDLTPLAALHELRIDVVHHAKARLALVGSTLFGDRLTTFPYL